MEIKFPFTVYTPKPKIELCRLMMTVGGGYASYVERTENSPLVNLFAGLLGLRFRECSLYLIAIDILRYELRVKHLR